MTCPASHRPRSWSASRPGVPAGPPPGARRGGGRALRGPRPGGARGAGAGGPPPPGLGGQPDGCPGRPHPGGQPGGLQLHQGHQPVSLAAAGHELDQEAAHAQRLGAQCRPGPVGSAGRGVPLVEQQVDHPEHRGEPFGPLLPARLLQRGPRCGQSPLGPHQPLGHRRLGGQVGPGDLARRQPGHQPQRQGGLRLGGQAGVAADEHQPQHVVLDVVEGSDDPLLAHLVSQLLGHRTEGAIAALASAECVDGPALGGRHQPGAGVAGYAIGRPLGQCRHEGVLGQVLGQADVADDPNQPGDQPSRLLAPDRLDGGRGGRFSHVTDQTTHDPDRDAGLSPSAGPSAAAPRSCPSIPASGRRGSPSAGERARRPRPESRPRSPRTRRPAPWPR